MSLRYQHYGCAELRATALIRAENPVRMYSRSIAAMAYCAGRVRFAVPVNGNGPPAEVVSAPRRLAAVPLVPTTHRSEELLAK